MTRTHADPEYFRNSRTVRRILTPRITAGDHIPCVNCGHPVQPGQRWDVGHIIDASRGGTNELSNLGASHRRCNRQAGGRLGAITTNNNTRRARRLPTTW